MLLSGILERFCKSAERFIKEGDKPYPSKHVSHRYGVSSASAPSSTCVYQPFELERNFTCKLLDNIDDETRQLDSALLGDYCYVRACSGASRTGVVGLSTHKERLVLQQHSLSNIKIN